MRSRTGLKAVSLSLGILAMTALVQAAVFVLSSSVALLADLVHNIGDALTAVPLGIAFLLRSERAERLAGLAVVLTIFASACVAFYEALARLLHPQDLSHLWALAAAGMVGFVGNELAAQVRLRAGRRLGSAALVADGHHARVDGLVSLGVVASATVVALGLRLADPLIGLAITLVILRDHVAFLAYGQGPMIADAQRPLAGSIVAGVGDASHGRAIGRLLSAAGERSA